MSDTHDTNATPEPKRLGLLAKFEGAEELVAAAERVTDDGYKKVEAFSPFAIIGIDDALKAKGTILPFISLVMGMTGCLAGLGMQLYCNGIEGPWWLSGYEFQISAKPGFSSVPAFIPVTFECIILLSAFGAFFGMLILNQLPKLSNPLFRNEGFARATDDGFFLFIDSNDPKYAEAETEAYLKSVGASSVEGIDEITEGHTVPGVIHMFGAATAITALLIPLYIWMTASTTSSYPRISLFKDMEAQAKFKAQTTSSLFDDGIAARKPIAGTVARGSGKDDYEYFHGYKSDSGFAGLFGSDSLVFASREAKRVPARFVSDEEDAAAPAEDEAANEKDWIKDFPESLTVNQTLMERGQQRYNIHCSACHGLAGNGDGLVSKRATKVSGATWAPPTSLHVEAVVTQPVGRIFDTISNGRRKMPGYASHITPEDRWAIVLYIQALQRSQNATADDLPADKRREMENRG